MKNALMMSKSGLYTRTGDAGETSLVDGSRVRKTSQRLNAYGTVDELSSALGMVASAPGVTEALQEEIRKVQNELFNVGCYLATGVAPGSAPECRSDLESRMSEVEGWIDSLDDTTPKIRAFVLPGGCPAASAAHLARTICRRCEREVLTLGETEYVDPRVTAYLNRLSDWLFILARYLNYANGIREITWCQE